MRLISTLGIATLYLTSVLGFTDYLLKDCGTDAFCNRNRHYAKEQLDSRHDGIYKVEKESISISIDGKFHANIVKTIERQDIDDIKVILPFDLYFINDNVVRFTIDEKQIGCVEENVKCQRYNDTWNWVTVKDYHNGASQGSHDSISWEPNSQRNTFGWFSSSSSNEESISIYSKDKNVKIIMQIDNFKLEVYQNDTLQLVINEQNFFNWEHYRSKETNFQNVLPFESTFNMFADSFEYSKFDSIPMGPQSVSVDFTFVNYENVYGIPEHADSLRLKDTTESTSDPYRLFNVDVFEYNVDSKQPMYGAIPLMIAARPQSSMGLLWLNPSDTWIDIDHSKDQHNTHTHWMSENGIIDVTLFFGTTPNDITNQYINLTGKPMLPSLSAIGHHQCRWNYNNELDVLTVEEKMDEGHFPFDFIWLDLDYTDNKKFFKWNPDTFPNPTRLLTKLNKLGRQLAILIDPHIMSKYDISEKIINSGAQVKTHLGRTFLGQCWPGQSIWIDTISKIGQLKWTTLFHDFISKYLPKIDINGNNLHFWNDMNEPSVFSGPETTAPKDLLHDGNIEERSIHNLYGLSVHETTYDAMKESYENLTRPFVLTRSFFVGSQRSAATWTGDNVANWDYLRISIPMILTNNIVGMPFIGADVAGFSGNPESELIVRWYQAGMWYPFFRAHAHIDTRRREPYLFEEPVKSIVREAIQLRYKLLPTFYTAFHEAYITGLPIMNPMFYVKPQFIELYDIDDQFYLSDSGIIVKPIVAPNVEQTTIILTPGIYYDLNTLESIVVEGNKVVTLTVDAPITKIPAFIEGGHIVARKDRYRRSSKLMANDPYTLVIAPDCHNEARGKLYLDDGKSFRYEDGQYLETNFQLTSKVIRNNPTHVPSELEQLDVFGSTLLESIIIPSSKVNTIAVGNTVTIKQKGEEWTVVVKNVDGVLTLENIFADLAQEWEIHL